MQRVAIVPPSPGKAKAVNAKQGGFFVPNTSRFCKGLKGFVGREMSSKPPLQGLAGCSRDAEAMLQNCWDSGWVAKAVLQVRQLPLLWGTPELSREPGRALPAPLWGPVLKTAQGPPAMLWQLSWVSSVKDWVTSGTPSSCASRAASQEWCSKVCAALERVPEDRRLRHGSGCAGGVLAARCSPSPPLQAGWGVGRSWGMPTVRVPRQERAGSGAGDAQRSRSTPKRQGC